MENVSKALLIAGAILVAVLIIGVGMYINNSATGSTQAALDSFSTQETEAFNNQLEQYLGEKKGSDVDGLIGKLIANSATYKDELDKVPSFIIDSKVNTKGTKVSNAERPTTSGNVGEYVNQLSAIRSALEAKHNYKIEVSYDTTGYIGEIKLIY